MSPIRTAITRARGPLFKFLTEGSIHNTTGSKADRVVTSTKKGHRELPNREPNRSASHDD